MGNCFQCILHWFTKEPTPIVTCQESNLNINCQCFNSDIKSTPTESCNGSDDTKVHKIKTFRRHSFS